MGNPKQLARLALMLLCYGVGNIHCSTVHENSEDFHSLLDFKQGITDPNGALSTWTNNTHFCRWHGVNCSSTPPYRVTELNLTGQSLGGQISSSLGSLTFLGILDLSNNSFDGPIPLLGKIQRLYVLSLANNRLQDAIPDALTNCSNLASLDLSGNNLTGIIPPRIGFLTQLESIVLDSNGLTGGIPAALGNITTLKEISFTQNQLNGEIPREVMKMPHLLSLYLDQNNLSGRIPEVWQMPNILVLDLSTNNLSGRIPQDLSNVSSLHGLSLTSNMIGNTLPSNIGDALPNLKELLLAQNYFEGQIPASLGKPPNLEAIELSRNYFTGQIPYSLGNLSLLSYLNLELNMFESTDSEGWEFFHAMENCKSLTILSLSYNKLQGAIPNSIANLSTSLTRLLMSGNILSGIVPPSIGKLSGLFQLSLDQNNLTGTIEEWIGNMTKLDYLNLQSNSFTGTIPPSTGHLTQLSYLSLAENQFTGFVPPNLGNLKSLSDLHLSYNNFQGDIPAEFGNFRQLTNLNLSSNKFSGKIPETLGNFVQIQTIQMDQNILTGNIPISFGNLYTLSMINLSHNNLSGLIPASLQDLESLTKLDLSFNNFQGEIPRNGVFNNVTIVSLDGNPGLCGGAMDFHKPPCHVAYQRKVGIINYIVKISIPIFSFMTLMLLIYTIIHGKKTSRRPYLINSSKVSYKDLAQATGNFSEFNLIGRGSYGSVYRGKLTQAKIQVAIKVFDLETRFADKSFDLECESLRTVRHRNLLPILTACSTIDNNSNDFKALIYEFMSNLNLDTWLYQKHGCVTAKLLGLGQRISIGVDVAEALAYLHHDCGRPIVHCDVKPTNILLDDGMNAHLGDFGIASLVVDSIPIAAGHSGCGSSLAVTGTIGYLAPEYAQTVHASTCGDVYSFGVVLLEMIIGKRPTDSMFDGDLSIISFAERNFPDQVLHVIDAHLQEECNGFITTAAAIENQLYQCVLSLVQVALACTRRLPRERMTMKEVAVNLNAIRKSYETMIKRDPTMLL
ncbi:hypothetical protein U9M48_022736 [Paspalum notatum var. saurae]|uniref:Receptor kinase-like protein Xa21 n=1 Tax=Paspalum notatum var. saurae TaxID=547442 RepID=A0AAQ3TMW6_PASNO